MGQAAQLLEVRPAFLRSLDAAGRVDAATLQGGHRRYSRRQLALAARLRELFDEGMTLEAATRIVALQDELSPHPRAAERRTRPARVSRTRELDAARDQLAVARARAGRPGGAQRPRPRDAEAARHSERPAVLEHPQAVTAMTEVLPADELRSRAGRPVVGVARRVELGRAPVAESVRRAARCGANWCTRLRWKGGGNGRPRGPTRSTVDAIGAACGRGVKRDGRCCCTEKLRRSAQQPCGPGAGGPRSRGRARRWGRDAAAAVVRCRSAAWDGRPGGDRPRSR